MTYELTIEPTGQVITVEEDQTILDAALRAGVWLPHACCHGLCATCKIQVLEGEIDQGEASNFALMDFEREEGKALACCATLQSDTVIEADIEEDPDAEIIPVKDFIGTVTAIKTLTPTVKGVFITLEEPLYFQAGQYINLNLEDGDTRAFSLANSPSKATEIELNIKLVPGGKGTTWIHEKLKVGDSIKLSGPYGRFFVRKSTNVPVLFIAGGSGLSSPKSMILDLLEQNDQRSITLINGQRNLTELYYHDFFQELAKQHNNFTYTASLSNQQETGWDGATSHAHEVAHEVFKGDFRNHQAYLCGPPPMIDACITTLIQGRLFEKDIFTEKFFSAADAQQIRSPLFKKI